MTDVTDMYDDLRAHGLGHYAAVRTLVRRLDIDAPTLELVIKRGRRKSVSAPSVGTPTAALRPSPATQGR